MCTTYSKDRLRVTVCKSDAVLKMILLIAQNTRRPKLWTGDDLWREDRDTYMHPVVCAVRRTVRWAIHDRDRVYKRNRELMAEMGRLRAELNSLTGRMKVKPETTPDLDVVTGLQRQIYDQRRALDRLNEDFLNVCRDNKRLREKLDAAEKQAAPSTHPVVRRMRLDFTHDTTHRSGVVNRLQGKNAIIVGTPGSDPMYAYPVSGDIISIRVTEANLKDLW